MATTAPSNFDEWQCLYDLLLQASKQFGTNDAFGDGDFWLVDDDWGDKIHKFHVFDLSSLSPELVHTFKGILAKFPGWKLMVALDVKTETGEQIPPEGLIIDASAIEEHWDKLRLMAMFGNRFRCDDLIS